MPWNSFFAICCFNKAPQDLPASREVWLSTVVAYILGSFLLTLISQDAAVSILSALIDTALLSLLTSTTLGFRGLSSRSLQTTTALFGTGFLFTLVAIPLSMLMSSLPETSVIVFPLFLFVISLLLWSIGVMAHILRHALSSSMFEGVLLAFLFVFVTTMIVTSLFPSTAIQ